MIGRKASVAVVLTIAGMVSAGCADQTPAPDDAGGSSAEVPMSVRFVEPTDGAEVTSPLRIVLGVEGVEIVPAGEQVPRSGHHHLLIDVDAPPAGTPVPSTEGYLHFGQAQTEFEVELEPGEHRLIALVGDFAHIPLDPSVADTITVVVR